MRITKFFENIKSAYKVCGDIFENEHKSDFNIDLSNVTYNRINVYCFPFPEKLNKYDEYKARVLFIHFKDERTGEFRFIHYEALSLCNSEYIIFKQTTKTHDDKPIDFKKYFRVVINKPTTSKYSTAILIQYTVDTTEYINKHVNNKVEIDEECKLNEIDTIAEELKLT